ncbi:MAG: alpha/beta hydrolase [candidate division Zixibacteria bacterium]|nr:alpha/beta hydrolase [candidate division Zixibacteria bacterium]
MSKTTKEIVQTTTIIELVVLIVAFYAVYPLIVVPDMVSRSDKNDFDDPEYSRLNDPAIFNDAGLSPDTLTFNTNDNIKLASLFFKPDSLLFDSIKGTVILLHPDDTDRTAIISYISPLLDSGLAVLAYDQRACGLSGGKHHFAGDYEADDLVDLIADLNIHEMLIPPVIAVGFDLGADAVIGAARDENRISATIAVDPYLSSSRWIARQIEKTEKLKIPLHNMIYYWWFQKHTGYPFDRTFADDLSPITANSSIYISDSNMEIDETLKLKEISDPNIVSISSKPLDLNDLQDSILLQILFYANNFIETADSL